MLAPDAGEGDWSAAVNGLAARLRIWLEDQQPGLRHAVWLELWNQAGDGIRVTAPPRIDAALATIDGTPITSSVVTAGGPQRAAQAALIPGGGYLGLRIDTPIIGMPTRGMGAALIAIGGQAWVIGSGRYRLSAAIVFPRPDPDRGREWTGELDLPPLDFGLRL